MTQPNYIAHVSMRGSDLLVKIDELEHINFISHSDSDMREQARHWISELEVMVKMPSPSLMTLRTSHRSKARIKELRKTD